MRGEALLRHAVVASLSAAALYPGANVKQPGRRLMFLDSRKTGGGGR